MFVADPMRLTWFTFFPLESLYEFEERLGGLFLYSPLKNVLYEVNESNVFEYSHSRQKKGLCTHLHLIWSCQGLNELLEGIKGI